MSNEVIHINKDTFDDVLKSAGETTVLVDFWAPWCGPCRALAPVLDQVAETLGAKAVIAKVNVDDNPELAERFGVSSIPALFFFKEGSVVKKLVGSRPAADIIEEIQSV